MPYTLQLLAIRLLSVIQTHPPSSERSSQFSKEEIEQFVAYHNKIRKEAGARPMTWDPKVAAFAQEWADKLAHEGQLRHRLNNRYGENLYFSMGGKPSVLAAAKAWQSEAKKYDGGPITEHNFMAIGHYSQMIWDSTERIGAGKVLTKSGKFYVCCDYDPPGNVIGQRPVQKER